MRYLRTNTDTRVTVGPFIDKTDGITPEVALTVTSEKLTLVVDTAGVPTLILDTAPTASGGANDMVHITNDDSGFYDLELAAANVNYLGRAMLSLNDVATHCPVFHEFMILPAMIYDALVLSTDRLDTNVTHITDQSQTARDIGASVLLSPGTGAGQLDITSGVVKANLVQIIAATLSETVGGYLAAGFKKLLDIATPVFTLASINQTGDAFPLASTEIAEIYAAVITNAAGADIAADIIAAKADTAAILTDTGTTLDAALAVVDANVDAILVDTGTTLDGRIPAALSGGKMESNIGSVTAGVIAAASFAANALDAVWASATRLLTAGTNIALAKGVGVTGFTDLSAAQVNAEVVDALATDTYAEPGQGTPAATTSLSAKIGYVYKFLRNRITQTSTTLKVYNDDAATVDHKATISDDTVTYDRGEIATGP